MSQHTHPASDEDATSSESYLARLAGAAHERTRAGLSRLYGGLRARLTTTDQPSRAPDSDDNSLFDGPTRLLLLSMGLPLVDGVFASIALSGALSTPAALLVTGATIFGGPWMLTILISEMAGDGPRQRLRRVLTVGALVVPAAGIEAVLAPAIASLLHLGVFHVFSALVILAVGAMIANDDLASRLPAPKWTVATGLVVSAVANLATGGSLRPALVVDPLLAAQAMTAAGLAVTVGLVTALVGPTLDSYLDMDRFRLGSGVALALIPFSIAGLLPSVVSLAVFGLAVLTAVEAPTPALGDRLDLERLRIGGTIALALLPFSVAGMVPTVASLVAFGIVVLFSIRV